MAFDFQIGADNCLCHREEDVFQVIDHGSWSRRPQRFPEGSLNFRLAYGSATRLYAKLLTILRNLCTVVPQERKIRYSSEYPMIDVNEVVLRV